MATIQRNLDDFDLLDADGDQSRAAVATETRHVLDTEGYVHELHLTAEHAKEYDDSQAEYLRAASSKLGYAQIVDRAPRARSGGSRPREGGQTLDREQGKQARAWARERGATLSDSGRIPNEVAYAWQNGDDERLARWVESRAARG